MGSVGSNISCNERPCRKLLVFAAVGAGDPCPVLLNNGCDDVIEMLKKKRSATTLIGLVPKVMRLLATFETVFISGLVGFVRSSSVGCALGGGLSDYITAQLYDDSPRLGRLNSKTSILVTSS